jgi:hypothetical protein
MKITAILSGTFLLFAAFLYGAVKADSGLVKLDSLEDQYEAVQFDHAKHISMTDNCAACHHEHAGNRMLCMECHTVSESTFQNSVARSFMACKNCHGSVDRDNPGMPGLKVAYHRVCFDCHRGMGNVGVEPRGCAELCHAKKQ